MNWFEKCAVVIPCLNEEEHIGALVKEVRTYVQTVIVVDDASLDRTAFLAKQEGAMVLTLGETRGKGNAIQIGMAAAAKQGFEWCVIMDGDGQHEPASIPRFFGEAIRSSSELVIGNRMDDPGKMPFVRQFVNRWMSKRLSTLAGQSFPDTQCGFRLLQLDAWSRLDLRCSHFEVESEMLIAAVKAGLMIHFVPISAVYKGEKSKIHPIKDSLRWFKWWLLLKAQPSRRRMIQPRPLLAEDGI
ncbi:MAG: glycosyltransferase family 2 protein [Verrucomicrobiales bacterium]